MSNYDIQYMSFSWSIKKKHICLVFYLKPDAFNYQGVLDQAGDDGGSDNLPNAFKPKLLRFQLIDNRKKKKQQI